ncbi:recombinase family protein [Tannockella kyphosi]|uniref:recombinase family protein n=1 Tax=Tannockella kyphosi TaxID=2899121 RepID=UPI002012C8DC|nr:recombinase family protein [Tannockella kyphosi]
MARKSRVNIMLDENAVVQMSNRFPTAIYARLSAENSGKGTDRDIIANQIEVCKSYIGENPHLDLMDIYTDDGYTGTKFDRPAFNRLMDDVKSGKIKCIVVRDLSRFGRDYIETGTYMERIFPTLGLRFIAVNERYDSFETDHTNEALMIPLQNMINTLYAKDISRKISASHRTRILSRDFKKNMIPYGYKLDETRYEVSIDEVAAHYVRFIFNWKIEGKSIKQMIVMLEEMNAPNPHIRKIQTGLRGGQVENFGGWHYSTIQNMLCNHGYLGHTVFGKTEIALYKGINRKEYREPDNWVILENTHEPIISEDVFNKVQEIRKLGAEKKQESIKRTEKKRAKLIDLFKGKIFCSDCGKTLSYIRMVDGNNFGAYYTCPTYARKKVCTKHSVNYLIVNATVLKVIQTQVKVALDYEVLLNKIKHSESDKSIRDKQNANISSLNLKINGISRKRSRLYEDYAEGVLDEEEYTFVKQSYDDDYNSLKMLLDEALQRRSKFNEAMSSDNKWISLMKSVSSAKILTQSLVDEVIEKVSVLEDGTLDIAMKYFDVFSLMQNTVAKVQEVTV